MSSLVNVGTVGYVTTKSRRPLNDRYHDILRTVRLPVKVCGICRGVVTRRRDGVARCEACNAVNGLWWSITDVTITGVLDWDGEEFG